MIECTVLVPVYKDRYTDAYDIVPITNLRELQELLIKNPGSIFYFDKKKFLIEQNFLNCDDED